MDRPTPVQRPGRRLSWLRRSSLLALPAFLAASFGTLAASPLPASAAVYTLTLQASATTVPTGESVTLTATASSVPDGYSIDIYEQGTQNWFATCYYSPCSQD